ncbi:Ubiquitin-like-conjugating enzyme ATG10 [Aphelenchoides fujianensis]|nr:Ubiquitin-like-conjugating enzyme ATG10 [Aphelenchoides fujianensis]
MKDPNCEEEFKLYEGAQGPYAEQRALVVSKEGDRRAVRLISVTYNEAFEQGGILHVDEFLPFLSTESSSSSVLQGLSQNEHPVHGIAFYNVHPCRTAELLKPLQTRNYLLTWLSVYGALLRLDVSEANRRVGS